MISNLTTMPKGWQACQLEETGEVVYGIQAAVANNLEPIGTRILTNKNITLDGRFDLEKINYFELKTARHKATVLQPGDILFNWRSGSIDHVGKTAIFRLPGEYVHSSFILRIRPNDSVSEDYLFYYLRHLRESGYYVRMHTYSINAKFNKSAVNTLPVVLPPLSEQKKIAHILSTVQQAIEAQERIIQTTTELKKALMQKLFTEGLHNEPQKQTEIGLVPESWEVADLGNVVNFFNGYAFKSKEAIPESNTQLVRMGNLYQNKLDLCRKPIFYPEDYTVEYHRYVLKEGDLIMSLTGTSGKEDYGFTVKLPKTDKTLLLNQRVTRIDITDKRLQKDFVHHFLLSRKFLDYLYPTAKGMKQANLSTHSMKKLKVLLPEKKEQNDIANCFKSLDAKIDVAERKTNNLQDLFRTLLHELMTAKIRVQNINDF